MNSSPYHRCRRMVGPPGWLDPRSKYPRTNGPGVQQSYRMFGLLPGRMDPHPRGHVRFEAAKLKVSLSFLRSCRYHARAMEDFQEVFDFLSEQRYPEGLTKDQKRNFR